VRSSTILDVCNVADVMGEDVRWGFSDLGLMAYSYEGIGSISSTSIVLANLKSIVGYLESLTRYVLHFLPLGEQEV
jgi:hypothetical protein